MALTNQNITVIKILRNNYTNKKLPFAQNREAVSFFMLIKFSFSVQKKLCAN
jgi:hypothetical protein